MSIPERSAEIGCRIAKSNDRIEHFQDRLRGKTGSEKGSRTMRWALKIAPRVDAFGGSHGRRSHHGIGTGSVIYSEYSPRETGFR